MLAAPPAAAAGFRPIPFEALQFPGGELGLPPADPFPFPEKKAPLPPAEASGIKQDFAEGQDIFRKVVKELDGTLFPFPDMRVSLLDT